MLFPEQLMYQQHHIQRSVNAVWAHGFSENAVMANRRDQRQPRQAHIADKRV